MLNCSGESKSWKGKTLALLCCCCWHAMLTESKEQYPVSHRMYAWLTSLAAEMKGYAVPFKKNPLKDIGLAQECGSLVSITTLKH
jgi:hypothetical protein